MSTDEERRPAPFLEMRNITKKFPGVVALQDVDIEVNLGEIVALMGENGAGKSTLMKILSGVYVKDQGEILINGKPAGINDPQSAIRCGISTIYQELNLLPNMDIAENIFLGREIRKGLFVDKKSLHEKADEFLRTVGLQVPSTTMVSALSTAQKQMIEVAKALSVNANLIIMDEPTSSLTDTETETLFEIMEQLKQREVGIVFISHRMQEIFRVADRVVVLRDGKMVSDKDAKSTDTSEIIRSMVGREVNDVFAKEEAEISDIVMEVNGLSTKDFLRDISFHVKKGEILGFAGLVGAGRSEVMRALFGVDRKDSGIIKIDGREVKINTTVDALQNRIGFLPEDRKEQALVLGMSVGENLSLACLRQLARFRFINKTLERQLGESYVDKLRVKTSGIGQQVMNLSGGNQQKVVLGKWLATESRVLILDEPTRGIDVGAKKEIHELMSKLARDGVAIIMISSELPEILGMSDRIIVMHEGRIRGELLRNEANQEKIMSMAISQ